MKKFLAMAVMSLAAANAMAGVKLVVRSDYVNTPSWDDNTGAEVSGTSLFQPSVARMYLMGNVGDAVIDSGFNLRAFTPSAFGTAGTDLTVQKTMTVDSFVDHLFLAKTYGQWTFSAGKLWSNVGGFERRASWDGDTYLVSAANGGTVGLGLNAYQASVVTPANISGVSAAYAITENHKVEVQVLNQTNSTTIVDNDASTDKMQFVNVAYWGSFVDGMIKPYLNYGFGGADTTGIGTGTFTGHEQTFWAAGFRFAPMANLGLDLEYISNTDDVSSGGTSNKRETNSAIIEARYNMNGWVPVLKYENSTVKDPTVAANAGDFDRNAFAVALEFVPKADEAFRYHIAYANVSDDWKGATQEKVDYSTITVGFKYAGDIAK